TVTRGAGRADTGAPVGRADAGAPPGSRSLEGLARRGDEGAERRGVAHREVGEVLAVDLDVGSLQTGHELRVRHVVLAAGGVDPNDPQAPELPLAGPAVAERVVAGVHHLLVGRPDVAAASAGVALGRVQYGAALLLRVDGTLDASND